MAKVYSGLHEAAGHIVPYIVRFNRATTTRGFPLTALPRLGRRESWQTNRAQPPWKSWEKRFANAADAILKPGTF